MPSLDPLSLPSGQASNPAAPPVDGSFKMIASRGFKEWLAEQPGALSFTTYQAGKIFVLGMRQNGDLTVNERNLARCMGYAVSPDSQHLYVSSHYQIHHFINQVAPGQLYEGFDRVYLPRTSYNTGDLDVHDMIVAPDGRPVFVNCMFNCLARIADGYSFSPYWVPPFISRLISEDRCHLNGITAGDDGWPKYVTAVSNSDISGGWREHRHDGGLAMDITTNSIVATGLSMPHSPRWRDGRLYLHDSGTGRFGYIEVDTGRFVEIAFCPGYLRGMTFSGHYAVVGLSKQRKERSFQGLKLDEELARHKVEARCAIYVIDLHTGAVAHSISIEGFIEELYDVQMIPRARCPLLIGFAKEDIKRMYTIGPSVSPFAQDLVKPQAAAAQ